MESTTIYEAQKDASFFYFKLLSGDVIEFPYVLNERINESNDGRIIIELETQIYCNTLYEIFRNKELIKSIKRISNYRCMESFEDSAHEYNYNTYFKITEFDSCSKSQCYADYTITFESI